MYWVAHMPGKSRDSQEGFRMKGRCLFIGDWWCKPVARRQFCAIHHPDRFKCSVSCLSTWWACKHGLRSACLNPPRHANSHLGCKVPRRLSLNLRLLAKKGGREKWLRFSCYSFPWSLAFRHQSLSYGARLCSRPKCEKNEKRLRRGRRQTTKS